MRTINEPVPENNYQGEHAELLIEDAIICFRTFLLTLYYLGCSHF